MPQEKKTIQNLIETTLNATTDLKNGQDFDDDSITKLLNDINQAFYTQEDLTQLQLLKSALDNLFGELKTQEKDMLGKLTNHHTRKTAHKAYMSGKDS